MLARTAGPSSLETKMHALHTEVEIKMTIAVGNLDHLRAVEDRAIETVIAKDIDHLGTAAVEAIVAVAVLAMADIGLARRARKL